MKVLVVHNRYRSDGPSGEDHVVDQESAALRERGHGIALFQRHSDTIGQFRMRHRAALPATALWGASSRQPFLDQLKSFRPDVVHVHNLFPLISPRVLRWCAEEQVPVVATLHNYNLVCAKGSMYRDDHPCFECMGGRVSPAVRHSCYHDSALQTVPVVAGLRLHRADWRSLVSAYVAISRTMLDQLGALDLPAARVFVKHNFVSSRPPSQDRESQVAYVGRLIEAKGTRVLQKAWDLFRRSSPDSPLRLAIAGGGPLAAEVSAWAQGHESVDYHGLLPREDVMDVLARSRCSVMPSVWKETFGLVAVESMALGVPPLAAAHGAFPELITPGRDGLLFDPRDPQALADLLSQVDQDPARFDDLGREARRTYETRFAPGPNIDRLLGIYEFAVANPVGRANQPVRSN